MTDFISAVSDKVGIFDQTGTFYNAHIMYDAHIPYDGEVSSNVNRVVDYFRFRTDSSLAADLIVYDSGILRYVLDSVGIEDFIVRTAEYGREVIDILSLEDFIKSSSAFIRNVSDSTALADAVSYFKSKASEYDSPPNIFVVKIKPSIFTKIEKPIIYK